MDKGRKDTGNSDETTGFEHIPEQPDVYSPQLKH
jgi:hypothetical protein